MDRPPRPPQGPAGLTSLAAALKAVPQPSTSALHEHYRHILQALVDAFNGTSGPAYTCQLCAPPPPPPAPERPDPVLMWPAWPTLLEPCQCRLCRNGKACRFRTELMRSAISEQRGKLDAIVTRLNAEDRPAADLHADLVAILRSVGGGPQRLGDERAYR